MVANYVTGRRVKVRTEELINACEMETLSRGTPPWIFSHIHSPSFVLQESRVVGGSRIIGSGLTGARVVGAGMRTAKVVRSNTELQSVLHFGETVKG